MELERYAKVLWKWLWLVVLASAVAGASSYWATRSAPRIYRTSTTVMVGQLMQDPDPSSSDIYLSQQLGQTYARLAVRQPVMQGAVEQLGLADQLSWQALAGKTSAHLVAGTQLLEISVNDTNPQRAKALADAVAEQLVLQSPSNPGADEEDRRAFASRQMADLEVKIADAESEIEELQKELDESISARRIQELQTQINAIENKVSSWQSSYAQLLIYLEGGEVNYLTIVEPAVVPVTPISPNVMSNVLLAVAIGATLAIGAAFLLDFMDDTIKTSDDIERVASLPVLGSVGRIREEESDSLPIAARMPSALIVENYRALRTNLQLSSGTLSRSLEGSPMRTLVITSADRIEGKSTTAANLAVVMAQSGLTTVLVDADLRRPVLHRKFSLTSVGLTEALLETSPLAGKPVASPSVWEYLQETPVENLRVMTGGHLPPNPAELLGSTHMRSVIRALEGEADIVIFDTPPAAIVTDAVVLAAQVDGVVLVVNAGATRRGMLRRTVEALQRAGTPIVGAVLNRVADRSDGYYYPRRYDLSD